MTNRLEYVQVLRGFAALAVLFPHVFRALTINMESHVWAPGSWAPHPALVSMGAAGVDVFFVLSGFIMILISGKYMSGERSILHFGYHRFNRVWPLYALVTAFVCVQLYLAYLQGEPLHYDLTPKRLLSFFFVPSFDVNGALHPILGVGWTLNYEMFFYVCFGALLLLKTDRIVLALAGVFLGFYVIGPLSGVDVFAAFFGNDVIFEFILGMALGKLYADRRDLFRFNGYIAIAVGVALVAMFKLTGLIEHSRFLTYGVATTVVFAGVLAFEARGGRASRFLLLLGDASYAIYLVHVPIIYLMRDSVVSFTEAAGLGPFALMASGVIMIVVATGAGVLVHKLIEKPMLSAGLGLFDKLTSAKAGLAPIK